ncbi:MAG TPA: hypothetical protein VK653_07235 [Xanthobacteraceae bacterium]|nr:hypothetical protein [Xanthobacteraceae bacterium]
MARDWRHFVFWLGVGVVGAAIWAWWWAISGFTSPICPEAGATGHCLSQNDIRAWTSWISDSVWYIGELANHWAALIAALFTGILAIFASRLWRSTDKLWNVTNQTLTHTEQTSKKELRAYISVEPLGINEYVGHNYLIGHFRIRNIGKLPAKNVSIYSTIDLDSDGARKNFPIGTPRISPTVLQPGAEMEFGSYAGYPIPADQLESSEPLKLKGYLYVWGEVLYTDEFNTVGWTAFCHRYPCDMFGRTKRKATAGHGANNRSIHRRFARYHEEAGNDAG